MLREAGTRIVFPLLASVTDTSRSLGDAADPKLSKWICSGGQPFVRARSRTALIIGRGPHT